MLDLYETLLELLKPINVQLSSIIPSFPVKNGFKTTE